MRFKTLYETPIAYDDDTESLAKRKVLDVDSNIVWTKAPPEHSDKEQILRWVNAGIKKKYLKGELIGRGSTRMVQFNDGKTIFKFNYGKLPFGNQTAKEVEVYKGFGKQYHDILAKIFKSGDHWYIQEYVNKVTPASFEHVTGVDYNMWDAFIQLGQTAPSVMFSGYYRAGADVEKLIKLIAKDAGGERGKSFLEILKSPELKRIIEFCAQSKVKIIDLDERNLGLRNGKLVILDWGI